MAGSALGVLLRHNRSRFRLVLGEFLRRRRSCRSLTRRQGGVPGAPIVLPSNTTLDLSPDNRSLLVGTVIRRVLPHFTPKYRITCVSSASRGRNTMSPTLLSRLKVDLGTHRGTPSIVT